MMIVVTVIPEIGVTEIIAIAHADTVVNRNAIANATTTETTVSHSGLSMPENTKT